MKSLVCPFTLFKHNRKEYIAYVCIKLLFSGRCCGELFRDVM